MFSVSTHFFTQNKFGYNYVTAYNKRKTHVECLLRLEKQPNSLTCVFKGGEGEGIVCQRPEEVRDVASVPEDLVCC